MGHKSSLGTHAMFAPGLLCQLIIKHGQRAFSAFGEHLVQGNLSSAKCKVFEKKNARSIVFSRYHRENVFRNFFTGALCQVMLKIEAFQNTHLSQGDIHKISTPRLSSKGQLILGMPPSLGLTHNVLQTTCSLQMTTTLHMLVIQVLHEDYLVPTKWILLRIWFHSQGTSLQMNHLAC